MKQKVLSLLSIILFIFLISCVSKSETRYTEAQKLKEKADKYELKEYAEQDYEEGEKNLNEGKRLMDSKKNMAAVKALDESNKNFQTVLDKGLPPKAEDQDKKALEQKEMAKEIKTEVAVKDKFDSAEQKYNEASQSYEAKLYENAIIQYSEAEEGYKEAYEEAKVKKEEAEKAIEDAEDYKYQMEEDIRLYEEEQKENEE
jgi:hypothetical protein